MTEEEKYIDCMESLQTVSFIKYNTMAEFEEEARTIMYQNRIDDQIEIEGYKYTCTDIIQTEKTYMTFICFRLNTKIKLEEDKEGKISIKVLKFGRRM